MASGWARGVLEALNKVAYSPSITWNQATTYAVLPEPSTASGATWLVLTGTGIWPVNKPAGWYYSDGSSWAYLGSYNPVVTGGNVTVANWPDISSLGEGWNEDVSDSGIQLFDINPTRKGFILSVVSGVIYIGLGFMPTSSKYTYRMTNQSTVEKDGFTGAVYARADAGTKTISITELK